MHGPLTALAHCTDAASLRSELHALCSNFGSVSHMHILPTSDGGKRRLVCFIRLASPAQEYQLMRQLGLERFGSDLFMVLDLAN